MSEQYHAPTQNPFPTSFLSMSSMVCVYRIEYAADAPKLEVLASQDADLVVFDGERKALRWPSEGLQLKPAALDDYLFQFYWLAPGVLVYREDLITECDDFYWIATQNIEALQARCGKVVFNIINIIDFMDPLRPGEPGHDTGAPCNVTSFYAPIFKIKGQPPTDLFCVSGLTNPMNEFKAVYDHYGFKDLTFRTVWSG